MAEFLFQKLLYVQKDNFFCIRENDRHIYTKYDDKEFILLFLDEISVLFYVNGIREILLKYCNLCVKLF